MASSISIDQEPPGLVHAMATKILSPAFVNIAVLVNEADAFSCVRRYSPWVILCIDTSASTSLFWAPEVVGSIPVGITIVSSCIARYAQDCWALSQCKGVMRNTLGGR
ncbi:hypothetical protein PG989_005738 [Apiospora arundinis]